MPESTVIYYNLLNFRQNFSIPFKNYYIIIRKSCTAHVNVVYVLFLKIFYLLNKFNNF